MKKLLVLLALCMVFSVALVACNNEPDEPVESTPESSEAPSETESEVPTETESETETTTETETESETESESESESETEPPVPVFEGNWHASVDSFLYCVNDDFSDVVAFTGANTNSTIGTTITNAANETLASVTANYVYFDNGWLAVDGYAIENWAVSIYAEDGTLLKTVALTLRDAEEGVVNHVSQNMHYAEGTVSHRVGQLDAEIISLKEFHNQNVTVVYSVDVVGTEFTIDLVKLDVAVPLDPNAPVAFVTGASMYPDITGGSNFNKDNFVVAADGSYLTVDTIGQGDPFYTIAALNAKGYVATHIAIKYRSTSTYTDAEMFVGSGAGRSGNGDNVRYTLVCDGKWQLAVVDVSALSAITDNVINYVSWDPFAGAADATMDVAYIALFTSAEAAVAYDAKFADVYVDTLNVPTSDWGVTGHRQGVQDATDGMVAAGGVEAGALLHQGYISLGNINLAEMSKVVIFYGVDGSQVTIDLHAAAVNNRIMLTSADQAMTNSPTEDVILAGATYTELGWAVHAIEIDLTGVDYNGPVYVTYDTLPGTFMLISSVEFIYDPNYVAPEEPEAPAEDPFYAVSFYQANKEATYYFTGAMDGYYLATSTNPADAAKVYIETHEEGLRMYVLVDGVKTYVEIYEYENNGTMKGGVHMTTEPTTFFVLNEEAGTYVTDLGATGIFYLGTYNNYTTVSASNISFITGDNASKVGVSQFPIEWTAYPEAVEPEEPAAPSYVDKATAGMIGESCDTVTLNAGMYFAEDGNAYAKLEAVENHLTIKVGDVIGFRGWIGFPQAFDQFGVIINDGEFLGGEYKQATEEIIYTLAGENASRYHVTVDTAGVAAGDYKVAWGAKLADGTVVVFYTVTITVEAA